MLVPHDGSVGAVADFEVCDAIAVDNVVQFTRIEPQAILVAYIDRDHSIPSEIAGTFAQSL